MENKLEEEVQKKYDIDLNNFEQVTLHNKRVYVKLYNKKDQSIIMLDISNINMPLKDYMKSLQNDLISYKTDNATNNAIGIIENQKQNRIALQFDQIENVNVNLIKDAEKAKIVKMFIKNKDQFIPKIKYINTKEAIAINEDGRVVEIFYNVSTNQYDTKYAESVAMQSEEKISENIVTTNLDGIDFEATLDYLEIENKEISLGNETINIEEIKKYDENESELQKSQISNNKKLFIQKLLEVYRKRKQNHKEETKDNPPKILQLTNQPKQSENKQAAFVSNNLTLFIGGFTSGIIFALILYYVIKIFF